MRLVVGPARWIGPALGLSGPADLIVLQSPDAVTDEIEPGRIRLRLTLRFNDIDGPREGLVPPDASIMRSLLAFGDEAACVVVQCFAGVSRSTAAAYALACQAAGAGSEARLAAELRRLSPPATPNALMVALADEILGRSGNMVRAIAGIGRGAEAFEGPVFAWDVTPAPADD